MNTLLKECVQAKTNETRWMVGGTNYGKAVGAAENRVQKAGDVPVRYVRLKRLAKVVLAPLKGLMHGPPRAWHGDTSGTSRA